MAKITSIGTIVASLACAISIAGCNQTDYSARNYSTKVGADSVSFVSRETSLPNLKDNRTYENRVIIYKQNGNIVEYIDSKLGDLLIDEIVVKVPTQEKKPESRNWLIGDTEDQTQNYVTKIYSRAKADDLEIINEAQKNWATLMEQLKKLRIEEGKKLVK